jgi:hypothetical protein
MGSLSFILGQLPASQWLGPYLPDIIGAVIGFIGVALSGSNTSTNVLPRRAASGHAALTPGGLCPARGPAPRRLWSPPRPPSRGSDALSRRLRRVY